ncbi:MAG: hypothetical protein QM680_06395 [Luteolibacter sp.]
MSLEMGFSGKHCESVFLSLPIKATEMAGVNRERRRGWGFLVFQRADFIAKPRKLAKEREALGNGVLDLSETRSADVHVGSFLGERAPENQPPRSR